MPKTTILVQTIYRPQCLKRLLESISLYAPKYQVLVHDDTKSDIGLSAARNKLVREATTPYVFLCDDDCVFTPNTNMAGIEKQFEDSHADILGITVLNNNIPLDYKGRFEVDGNTVKLVPEEPLEFIPNVFIAKKKTLLKHTWRNDLKLGEHFAFFFDYHKKLLIKTTDRYSIEHKHESSVIYNRYRNRAPSYVKMYMKSVGIRVRIDLNGEILCC